MKYLKKPLIFIQAAVIALVLTSNLFAQSTAAQPDQRILDVYGTTHTNFLMDKAPERIAYLNYFLDNSYEVVEITYHPDEKLPKVSSVSLNTKYSGPMTRPTFDVNNFNVLLYNFKRNKSIKTLYRVDDTNKVIAFYAEEKIAEAFNQTK